MSDKQLQTLLKFETDKEQREAKMLQQSQQHYQQQQDRIQGISNYRLEYMKRLQNMASDGMTSATFGHYQAFLDKLDNALTQQQMAASKAQQVVQQRRASWLKQRQKVDSVKLLLDKHNQRKADKAQREEQKMFDEIAMQQYIRRAG